MIPYHFWPPLSEIVTQVKSGTITARSQVVKALDLAKNEILGSNVSPTFISLHSAEALFLADRIDSQIARGEAVGDLAGIPIAVKDNIDWAGLITSAGSPRAYSKKALQTAPVLQKLIDRGAIPIGKTNLNEWAVGLTGESVHYGDVINPYLDDCLSGGSSSGSARAVAMGIVPAALGSDTGGSIRMPAAWCGIVGLRPSSNSFSLDGVVPRSRTLDVVGPLTKTLDDCAYFLGDLFLPNAKQSSISQGNDLIRIGWDPELLRVLSTDVRAAFTQWMNTLQHSQRVFFVEQQWPSLDLATQNALVVLQKEFYDDFLLMCGDVDNFSSCLGNPVLNELRNSKNLKSADLDQALSALRRFAAYFEEAFDAPNKEVDLFAVGLTPCGPVVQKDLPNAAKPLRELSLAMGATGLPILGIPLIAGVYSAESLAGVQLIGRKHHEHQLISVVKRLMKVNN
jgi:Asp-tRNA(Asn)/Glu-tRNA(Gln) amidotransferase A subunit family amidase